jgi:hypothetical protein
LIFFTFLAKIVVAPWVAVKYKNFLLLTSEISCSAEFHKPLFNDPLKYVLSPKYKTENQF